MTVNDYLKNLSPSQLSEYNRIAKIVEKLVPNCEIAITYNIPTWEYKGHYVLYFAAYKTHMSVYPASVELLDELKDKIGNFKITAGTKKAAGTIQFSSDNPVPEIVIREIVLRRTKEIDNT
jgi:uncharacterized protein YdhG (YjbR/CyaY superfamily)